MPFYKQNYKRVRFHVEFGPPSLFERVRFKMKDVTTLYMDGVHFQTHAILFLEVVLIHTSLGTS